MHHWSNSSYCSSLATRSSSGTVLEVARNRNATRRSARALRVLWDHAEVAM
jgi:hypothetical protein